MFCGSFLLIGVTDWLLIIIIVIVIIIASMLLVGRQEGHPACKKLEWWGAGVVICLGEMQTCIWPG